jgi:hypothetical protein
MGELFASNSFQIANKALLHRRLLPGRSSLNLIEVLSEMHQTPDPGRINPPGGRLALET